MKWAKWVGMGIVLLIALGLVWQEVKRSLVIGHPKYRFNMVLIAKEQGINFFSFDPSERTLLSMEFPVEMVIKSHSQGEYPIASLYKLGSYDGNGGYFVRQKIQGFMRVPVPGYIVSNKSSKSPRANLRLQLIALVFGRSESNLSKLDAAYLLLKSFSYRLRSVSEDELIRKGVVENKTYHPERLQEFVGSRLFDWGIGAKGTTVAIINMSGVNGLGSDMADFLNNLGLDVVMVRSDETAQLSERSTWQVEDKATSIEMKYIFENLFGFGAPKIEKLGEEYRSQILIQVGKDMVNLF